MLSTEIIYIFNQQTTNATSSNQYLDLTSNKAVVSAWGTWGGAQLQLQVGTIPTLDNVTTWVTIRDRFNIPFTFTENITITLTEYVNNQPIRGIITNASGSTVINCIIQVI